jgi:mono/diheme cytochrome c family protein
VRWLLLWSSSLLVACDWVSASREPSVWPAPRDYMVATPGALLRGAEVFGERCSPCHGETGHGDGILADLLPIRPRNYHSEPFKWGRTPAGIVETIARGRNDVMPAFKGALDEADMWAVAHLVWAWMPPAQRAEDTPEALANWKLP